MKPTKQRTGIAALAQLLLLVPALLFMTALVLRGLAGLAFARRVVDWYAGRIWSLWGLLVLLPLGALAVGCAALLQDGSLLERIYATGEGRDGPGTAGNERLSIPPSMWLVALETLAAGVILAVVGAHVLMN
jgi:hypothetical protein